MKKSILSFRTIILSDLHLGAPGSQVDKINYFLKHSYSPTLILNGDIIDGWSLTRKGGWTIAHTRTVRLLLKKMEKHNTDIIYLRGNHDDILDRFLPLDFEQLRIVERHIHEGVHQRYLVVHGDLFDTVTCNSRWLAILGDIGYQSLLRLNRAYNRYRAWRGKEYFSLSKAIKARVKQAVSYVSKFEQQVEGLAVNHACGGIICGHIHTPANKMVGSVHYLNSGDWVESNTALVEHFDGSWEVLPYETFLERLAARQEPAKRLVAESGRHVEVTPISESQEEELAFGESSLAGALVG